MNLVKIYKDGCVPCVRVSNFLQDQGVDYVDINVMKEPEKAMAYNIGFSVPVLILMDGEEEVKRVSGYNEAVMEEMISLL